MDNKINNLNQQIINIVYKIRKYDYSLFKVLIKNEYLPILETAKISDEQNNKRFLEECLVELNSFLNFIGEIDLEVFEYFIMNILKQDDLKISTLEKISNYHDDLSLIFFKYISKVEQNIKNKIIWYTNQIDKEKYYFYNLVETLEDKYKINRFSYLIKRIEKIILLNPNLEERKNYLLISEFGINDLILFFTQIKDKMHKESFGILNFLKILFGEKKFNKIYNASPSEELYVSSNGRIEIVQWFLDQLLILKKVRNKVMHNRIIFRDLVNSDYSMEFAFQAIINLSYEKHNNGKFLLNDATILTNNLLIKIKNKSAQEFFDEHILKISKK